MFIVIFFSPDEESKIGILQPLCLSYGNHDIFNLLLLQQLTLFWSSVIVHWPQCAVRLLEWHLFVQTEVLVQIYWNLGCCPALEAENVVFVQNVFFPHSPRWCLKWALRLNSSHFKEIKQVLRAKYYGLGMFSRFNFLSINKNFWTLSWVLSQQRKHS